MRTGEELYQVFEDNQDLFKRGICSWIIRLLNQKLITGDEYDFITILIKKEMEKQKKTFFEYLWQEGLISYRLEWLKQTLIK